MTGAADRTWDLELVTDMSLVDGDAISLVYGSGSEAGLGETVVISIEGDRFSISTDGGTADIVGRTGEGCTHTLMPNHGPGVAGTFECTHLSALAGDESVVGRVDVSGTFQADE